MERLKDGARWALVSVVGIVSLLAPATAAADLPAPGPNGRIAFTSGRAEGAKPADNNTSQIWLMDSLGGSLSRLSTDDTVQFRHPAWSPDGTKLAYASGPAAGPWEIFVRDLTQPISGTNPRNITNTGGTVSEDRPAWSPDGLRIAYQGDQGANLDIKVRNADGTGLNTVATNVEAGGAASFNPRPHWTPDSLTVFYAKNIGGAALHDIYKSFADGSQPLGVAVITGPSNDIQPYVSPDGTKVCFTRGASKDIYVALSTGGPGVGTALDTNAGEDFECAWSPDQKKIAYARGAANAGQVYTKNSDGTGVPALIADVAATFDGNPDWGVNVPPACQNGSAVTTFNSAVTIPLGCTDLEGQSVARQIVTNPAHGSLSAINNANNTVTYTPNAGFSGSDSFTFKGSDGALNSNTATVGVTVGADITAAVIRRVRVRPKRWRRGRRLPRVVGSRRAKVGTTISYRLSEAARVTLTFSRRARGRKVGRRCRKPTRRNRTRRRCTRYVKAGTLRFNGKAGLNRVKFQGRLSRRKRLKIGRYRLTVGARDLAGNVSKRRRAYFRIVRR